MPRTDRIRPFNAPKLVEIYLEHLSFGAQRDVDFFFRRRVCPPVGLPEINILDQLFELRNLFLRFTRQTTFGFLTSYRVDIVTRNRMVAIVDQLISEQSSV